MLQKNSVTSQQICIVVAAFWSLLLQLFETVLAKVLHSKFLHYSPLFWTHLELFWAENQCEELSSRLQLCTALVVWNLQEDQLEVFQLLHHFFTSVALVGHLFYSSFSTSFELHPAPRFLHNWLLRRSPTVCNFISFCESVQNYRLNHSLQIWPVLQICPIFANMTIFWKLPGYVVSFLFFF